MTCERCWDATDSTPRMEAGRLLIRLGRVWVEKTAEDVERGARAVVADPTYRTEIWRSAVRHAEQFCTCPSVAEVNHAYDLLGGAQ